MAKHCNMISARLFSCQKMLNFVALLAFGMTLYISIYIYLDGKVVLLNDCTPFYAFL